MPGLAKIAGAVYGRCHKSISIGEPIVRFPLALSRAFGIEPVGLWRTHMH
jgi:hypothetical protein